MPRWVKCLVNRPKIRPSFTLLELIVVISVVVILAGVSAYQFRNGQTKQDLRTAADELTATWQEMQTRALAGASIPLNVGSYSGISDSFYDPFNPFVDDPQPSASEGYGLLLFGPYFDSNYVTLWCELLQGDQSVLFANGYVAFGGCAIPHPSYLEENMTLPTNWSPAISNGFNAYKAFCFTPIRQYAPTVPQKVAVKPDSIKVGKNATELYQIMSQTGPLNSWEMRSFNFEHCQLASAEFPEDVPSEVKGAIFLAIDPPRPTYYVNGRQGCKIVQFALTSLNNPNVELWVRLDLNTGRVSYYDSEPGQ